MPAKKQKSERKAKPRAHVVGRSLDPIVGTPRSDEACEDAEVWASRNPKGPVVPYRLAARMERELCAVKNVLSEILDGVPMWYPKPCNFVMNVSHRKIEAARAAINSSNPGIDARQAEQQTKEAR